MLYTSSVDLNTHPYMQLHGIVDQNWQMNITGFVSYTELKYHASPQKIEPKDKILVEIDNNLKAKKR